MRITLLNKGAVLTAVLLTSSCAPDAFKSSKVLPLCPAIAKNSYPTSGSTNPINYYSARQAEAFKLEIRPLSQFTAMFVGDKASLQKFTENYKFMLCAFNPESEVMDRETYLSCMNHADEWISIVSSKNPENLMLRETLFKENCV